ncbi:hypothetical protein BDA96_05G214100 [Sorghum bicolor]|nr:hypothetical protein BDA96_05G214100 [Sorghum bicolor]
MRNKEEGIVPAVEEKKPPRRRMTQEQIELLTRYETVHMPEEAFRRLSLRSKEVLTPADLADQGELPVPMDQIDDYIANICREINECEARFMRQRDRILNDYYTKGYAHEEEEEGEEASSPALPAPVVCNGRFSIPMNAITGDDAIDEKNLLLAEIYTKILGIL